MVQGRLAVAVAHVDISTLQVQPPRHIHLPMRAREVQRRLALGVHGVHLGTLAQKALRCFQPPFDARVGKGDAVHGLDHLLRTACVQVWRETKKKY
eukprot:2546731-Prymnesium_polylepis.1